MCRNKSNKIATIATILLKYSNAFAGKLLIVFIIPATDLFLILIFR